MTGMPGDLTGGSLGPGHGQNFAQEGEKYELPFHAFREDGASLGPTEEKVCKFSIVDNPIQPNNLKLKIFVGKMEYTVSLTEDGKNIFKDITQIPVERLAYRAKQALKIIFTINQNEELSGKIKMRDGVVDEDALDPSVKEKWEERKNLEIKKKKTDATKTLEKRAEDCFMRLMNPKAEKVAKMHELLKPAALDISKRHKTEEDDEDEEEVSKALDHLNDLEIDGRKAVLGELVTKLSKTLKKIKSDKTVDKIGAKLAKSLIELADRLSELDDLWDGAEGGFQEFETQVGAIATDVSKVMAELKSNKEDREALTLEDQNRFTEDEKQLFAELDTVVGPQFEELSLCLEGMQSFNKADFDGMHEALVFEKADDLEDSTTARVEHISERIDKLTQFGDGLLNVKEQVSQERTLTTFKKGTTISLKDHPVVRGDAFIAKLSVSFLETLNESIGICNELLALDFPDMEDISQAISKIDSFSVAEDFDSEIEKLKQMADMIDLFNNLIEALEKHTEPEIQAAAEKLKANIAIMILFYQSYSEALFTKLKSNPTIYEGNERKYDGLEDELKRRLAAQLKGKKDDDVNPLDEIAEELSSALDIAALLALSKRLNGLTGLKGENLRKLNALKQQVLDKLVAKFSEINSIKELIAELNALEDEALKNELIQKLQGKFDQMAEELQSDESLSKEEVEDLLASIDELNSPEILANLIAALEEKLKVLSVSFEDGGEINNRLAAIQTALEKITMAEDIDTLRSSLIVLATLTAQAKVLSENEEADEELGAEVVGACEAKRGQFKEALMNKFALLKTNIADDDALQLHSLFLYVLSENYKDSESNPHIKSYLEGLKDEMLSKVEGVDLTINSSCFEDEEDARDLVDSFSHRYSTLAELLKGSEPGIINYMKSLLKASLNSFLNELPNEVDPEERHVKFISQIIEPIERAVTIDGDLEARQAKQSIRNDLTRFLIQVYSENLDLQSLYSNSDDEKADKLLKGNVDICRRELLKVDSDERIAQKQSFITGQLGNSFYEPLKARLTAIQTKGSFEGFEQLADEEFLDRVKFVLPESDAALVDGLQEVLANQAFVEWVKITSEFCEENIGGLDATALVDRLKKALLELSQLKQHLKEGKAVGDLERKLTSHIDEIKAKLIEESGKYTSLDSLGQLERSFNYFQKVLDIRGKLSVSYLGKANKYLEDTFVEILEPFLKGVDNIDEASLIDGLEAVKESDMTRLKELIGGISELSQKSSQLKGSGIEKKLEKIDVRVKWIFVKHLGDQCPFIPREDGQSRLEYMQANSRNSSKLVSLIQSITSEGNDFVIGREVLRSFIALQTERSDGDLQLAHYTLVKSLRKFFPEAGDTRYFSNDIGETTQTAIAQDLRAFLDSGDESKYEAYEFMMKPLHPSNDETYLDVLPHIMDPSFPVSGQSLTELISAVRAAFTVHDLKKKIDSDQDISAEVKEFIRKSSKAKRAILLENGKSLWKEYVREFQEKLRGLASENNLGIEVFKGELESLTNKLEKFHSLGLTKNELPFSADVIKLLKGVKDFEKLDLALSKEMLSSINRCGGNPAVLPVYSAALDCCEKSLSTHEEFLKEAWSAVINIAVDEAGDIDQIELNLTSLFEGRDSEYFRGQLSTEVALREGKYQGRVRQLQLGGEGDLDDSQGKIDRFFQLLENLEGAGYAKDSALQERSYLDLDYSSLEEFLFDLIIARNKSEVARVSIDNMMDRAAKTPEIEAVVNFSGVDFSDVDFFSGLIGNLTEAIYQEAKKYESDIPGSVALKEGEELQEKRGLKHLADKLELGPFLSDDPNCLVNEMLTTRVAEDLCAKMIEKCKAPGAEGDSFTEALKTFLSSSLEALSVEGDDESALIKSEVQEKIKTILGSYFKRNEGALDRGITIEKDIEELSSITSIETKIWGALCPSFSGSVETLVEGDKDTLLLLLEKFRSQGAEGVTGALIDKLKDLVNDAFAMQSAEGYGSYPSPSEFSGKIQAIFEVIKKESAESNSKLEDDLSGKANISSLLAVLSKGCIRASLQAYGSRLQALSEASSTDLLSGEEREKVNIKHISNEAAPFEKTVKDLLAVIDSDGSYDRVSIPEAFLHKKDAFRLALNEEIKLIAKDFLDSLGQNERDGHFVIRNYTAGTRFIGKSPEELLDVLDQNYTVQEEENIDESVQEIRNLRALHLKVSLDTGEEKRVIELLDDIKSALSSTINNLSSNDYTGVNDFLGTALGYIEKLQGLRDKDGEIITSSLLKHAIAHTKFLSNDTVPLTQAPEHVLSGIESENSILAHFLNLYAQHKSKPERSRIGVNKEAADKLISLVDKLYGIGSVSEESYDIITNDPVRMLSRSISAIEEMGEERVTFSKVDVPDKSVNTVKQLGIYARRIAAQIRELKKYTGEGRLIDNYPLEVLEEYLTGQLQQIYQQAEQVNALMGYYEGDKKIFEPVVNNISEIVNGLKKIQNFTALIKSAREESGKILKLYQRFSEGRSGLTLSQLNDEVLTITESLKEIPRQVKESNYVASYLKEKLETLLFGEYSDETKNFSTILQGLVENEINAKIFASGEEGSSWCDAEGLPLSSDDCWRILSETNREANRLVEDILVTYGESRARGIFHLEKVYEAVNSVVSIHYEQKVSSLVSPRLSPRGKGEGSGKDLVKVIKELQSRIGSFALTASVSQDPEMKVKFDQEFDEYIENIPRASKASKLTYDFEYYRLRKGFTQIQERNLKEQKAIEYANEKSESIVTGAREKITGNAEGSELTPFENKFVDTALEDKDGRGKGLLAFIKTKEEAKSTASRSQSRGRRGNRSRAPKAISVSYTKEKLQEYVREYFVANPDSLDSELEKYQRELTIKYKDSDYVEVLSSDDPELVKIAREELKKTGEMGDLQRFIFNKKATELPSEEREGLDPKTLTQKIYAKMGMGGDFPATKSLWDEMSLPDSELISLMREVRFSGDSEQLRAIESKCIEAKKRGPPKVKKKGKKKSSNTLEGDVTNKAYHAPVSFDPTGPFSDEVQEDFDLALRLRMKKHFEKSKADEKLKHLHKKMRRNPQAMRLFLSSLVSLIDSKEDLNFAITSNIINSLRKEYLRLGLINYSDPFPPVRGLISILLQEIIATDSLLPEIFKELYGEESTAYEEEIKLAENIEKFLSKDSSVVSSGTSSELQLVRHNYFIKNHPTHQKILRRFDAYRSEGFSFSAAAQKIEGKQKSIGVAEHQIFSILGNDPTLSLDKYGKQTVSGGYTLKGGGGNLLITQEGNKWVTNIGGVRFTIDPNVLVEHPQVNIPFEKWLPLRVEDSGEMAIIQFSEGEFSIFEPDIMNPYGLRAFSLLVDKRSHVEVNLGATGEYIKTLAKDLNKDIQFIEQHKLSAGREEALTGEESKTLLGSYLTYSSFLLIKQQVAKLKREYAEFQKEVSTEVSWESYLKGVLSTALIKGPDFFEKREVGKELYLSFYEILCEEEEGEYSVLDGIREGELITLGSEIESYTLTLRKEQQGNTLTKSEKREGSIKDALEKVKKPQDASLSPGRVTRSLSSRASRVGVAEVKGESFYSSLQAFGELAPPESIERQISDAINHKLEEYDPKGTGGIEEEMESVAGCLFGYNRETPEEVLQKQKGFFREVEKYHRLIGANYQNIEVNLVKNIELLRGYGGIHSLRQLINLWSRGKLPSKWPVKRVNGEVEFVDLSCDISQKKALFEELGRYVLLENLHQVLNPLLVQMRILEQESEELVRHRQEWEIPGGVEGASEYSERIEQVNRNFYNIYEQVKVRSRDVIERDDRRMTPAILSKLAFERHERKILTPNQDKYLTENIFAEMQNSWEERGLFSGSSTNLKKFTKVLNLGTGFGKTTMIKSMVDFIIRQLDKVGSEANQEASERLCIVMAPEANQGDLNDQIRQFFSRSYDRLPIELNFSKKDESWWKQLSNLEALKVELESAKKQGSRRPVCISMTDRLFLSYALKSLQRQEGYPEHCKVLKDIDVMLRGGVHVFDEWDSQSTSPFNQADIEKVRAQLTSFIGELGGTLAVSVDDVLKDQIEFMDSSQDSINLSATTGSSLSAKIRLDASSFAQAADKMTTDYETTVARTVDLILKSEVKFYDDQDVASATDGAIQEKMRQVLAYAETELEENSKSDFIIVDSDECFEKDGELGESIAAITARRKKTVQNLYEVRKGQIARVFAKEYNALMQDVFKDDYAPLDIGTFSFPLEGLAKEKWNELKTKDLSDKQRERLSKIQDLKRKAKEFKIVCQIPDPSTGKLSLYEFKHADSSVAGTLSKLSEADLRHYRTETAGRNICYYLNKEGEVGLDVPQGWDNNLKSPLGKHTVYSTGIKSSDHQTQRMGRGRKIGQGQKQVFLLANEYKGYLSRLKGVEDIQEEPITLRKAIVEEMFLKDLSKDALARDRLSLLAKVTKEFRKLEDKAFKKYRNKQTFSSAIGEKNRERGVSRSGKEWSLSVGSSTPADVSGMDPEGRFLSEAQVLSLLEADNLSYSISSLDSIGSPGNEVREELKSRLSEGLSSLSFPIEDKTAARKIIVDIMKAQLREDYRTSKKGANLGVREANYRRNLEALCKKLDAAGSRWPGMRLRVDELMPISPMVPVDRVTQTELNETVESKFDQDFGTKVEAWVNQLVSCDYDVKLNNASDVGGKKGDFYFSPWQIMVSLFEGDNAESSGDFELVFKEAFIEYKSKFGCSATAKSVAELYLTCPKESSYLSVQQQQEKVKLFLEGGMVGGREQPGFREFVKDKLLKRLKTYKGAREKKEFLDRMKTQMLDSLERQIKEMNEKTLGGFQGSRSKPSRASLEAALDGRGMGLTNSSYLSDTTRIPLSRIITDVKEEIEENEQILAVYTGVNLQITRDYPDEVTRDGGDDEPSRDEDLARIVKSYQDYWDMREVVFRAQLRRKELEEGS